MPNDIMIITPAAQPTSVHWFLIMLDVYGCPGMAVKLPFFTRGYEFGGEGRQDPCLVHGVFER